MSAQSEIAEKTLSPKSPAENVAANVAARVDQAREKAENLYHRSKDRALEMEGQFEDYVRERPVRSTLIAAGVGAGIGLILGVLLARR
jgi:ElaB/YqjD/DUF883 family membrane-anchored ribosome-binding protein